MSFAYSAVHGLMLNANFFSIFFFISGTGCFLILTCALGLKSESRGIFGRVQVSRFAPAHTCTSSTALSSSFSAEVWRNHWKLWLKLLFSSQGIRRSPVFCWTMEPVSPRTHWWITQTSAGSCSDSATCRTKTSRWTGRCCRWDSSRWIHFRSALQLRFTEVLASALVPLFKCIQNEIYYLFINTDK